MTSNRAQRLGGNEKKMLPICMFVITGGTEFRAWKERVFACTRFHACQTYSCHLFRGDFAGLEQRVLVVLR